MPHSGLTSIFYLLLQILILFFQYINDLDPFLQSTNNLTREPLKPLIYSVALHRPIGEQLADIIRQLKAPHKVCLFYLEFRYNCKIAAARDIVDIC